MGNMTATHVINDENIEEKRREEIVIYIDKLFKSYTMDALSVFFKQSEAKSIYDSCRNVEEPSLKRIRATYDAVFEISTQAFAREQPGHAPRGDIPVLNLNDAAVLLSQAKRSQVEALFSKSAIRTRLLQGDYGFHETELPVVSTEHGCNPCGAAGAFTCNSCGGQGATDCFWCVMGKKTCPVCMGSGTLRDDRGEYTPCYRCYTNYPNGKIECDSCLGTSRISCGGCNGYGEITCNNCHGHGILSQLHGIKTTITGELRSTSNLPPKEASLMDEWALSGFEGETKANDKWLPWTDAASAPIEYFEQDGVYRTIAKIRSSATLTIAKCEMMGQEYAFKHLLVGSGTTWFTPFLDQRAQLAASVASQGRNATPSAFLADLEDFPGVTSALRSGYGQGNGKDDCISLIERNTSGAVSQGHLASICRSYEDCIERFKNTAIRRSVWWPLLAAGAVWIAMHAIGLAGALASLNVYAAAGASAVLGYVTAATSIQASVKRALKREACAPRKISLGNEGRVIPLLAAVFFGASAYYGLDLWPLEKPEYSLNGINSIVTKLISGFRL